MTRVVVVVVGEGFDKKKERVRDRKKRERERWKKNVAEKRWKVYGLVMC